MLDINLRPPSVSPAPRCGRCSRHATAGSINVSSVSGLRANPGQANYAASKAGLIGFTQTVAVEVARRGVTVNAVAPGLIETELTRDVGRIGLPARRDPGAAAGDARGGRRLRPLSGLRRGLLRDRSGADRRRRHDRLINPTEKGETDDNRNKRTGDREGDRRARRVRRGARGKPRRALRGRWTSTRSIWSSWPRWSRTSTASRSADTDMDKMRPSATRSTSSPSGRS